IDQVEVNDGTLWVDGVLSGGVLLRNGALLGGEGQVSGTISTQGSAVQTVDDGILGGFTTRGWRTVTGQGFGSDLSVAAPSVSTGSVVTATWAFTGLAPGLYRVFATWTGGSDRTSF